MNAKQNSRAGFAVLLDFSFRSRASSPPKCYFATAFGVSSQEFNFQVASQSLTLIVTWKKSHHAQTNLNNPYG